MGGGEATRDHIGQSFTRFHPRDFRATLVTPSPARTEDFELRRYMRVLVKTYTPKQQKKMATNSGHQIYSRIISLVSYVAREATPMVTLDENVRFE